MEAKPSEPAGAPAAAQSPAAEPVPATAAGQSEPSAEAPNAPTPTPPQPGAGGPPGAAFLHAATLQRDAIRDSYEAQRAAVLGLIDEQRAKAVNPIAPATSDPAPAADPQAVAAPPTAVADTRPQPGTDGVNSLGALLAGSTNNLLVASQVVDALRALIRHEIQRELRRGTDVGEGDPVPDRPVRASQ